MMQISGGMVHPGIPNIGEAGGMSQPGIRMVQIPRGKAEEEREIAQEPAAVSRIGERTARVAEAGRQLPVRLLAESCLLLEGALPAAI